MKQLVPCLYCRAPMLFIMGPVPPNVMCNTYWAECRRMDIEARRDQPDTIWPQRCGNICYRNIPATISH